MNGFLEVTSSQGQWLNHVAVSHAKKTLAHLTRQKSWRALDHFDQATRAGYATRFSEQKVHGLAHDLSSLSFPLLTAR